MDNELFPRKNTTSELFMTQLLLTTCEHKRSTRSHVTDVNQWQSVYINTGDNQRRSLVNKYLPEFSRSFVMEWQQERLPVTVCEKC